MNISISGHHVSVTDAMDTAVREKMAKIEHLFDQIQSIKVILSLQHSPTRGDGSQKSNKAEAILRVPGNEMFVQAYGDDMYKAIADMADKLERKVRKYKTRLERRKTRGVGRDELYGEGDNLSDTTPTT